MVDKLGGKIMTNFVGLKDAKKYGIKRKFKFENYKNCLETNKLGNEIKNPEKIKLT